jgi:hypothetical protein
LGRRLATAVDATLDRALEGLRQRVFEGRYAA